MKFPLEHILVFITIFSFAVLFSGVYRYWNPNVKTLSQALGNYNQKIYFFILVLFVALFCLYTYEIMKNDIVSIQLFSFIAIPLFLLTWISEDTAYSFRNKCHVSLSIVAFVSTILYILYHGIRTKDPYVLFLFALCLMILLRLLYLFVKTYKPNGEPQNLLFEEATVIIFFLLTVLRRENLL